ncbi:MAG: nitroreductase family protein [Chitinispirillaceae bacterium]|nr:nitroreductase family protein [Chitinispirillaceae bacterium]
MLLDVFTTRQSVREYSAKPVEREKIASCIEAARLAPSACNSQPWKIIVIDEPALRNRVAGALHDAVMKGNRFALDVPVLVAVVAERSNFTATVGGLLKRKPFAWIDAAIAAEHFCLQAAAEGLGTCMIGWFSEGKVKKLLGIPRLRRVPLMLTLGYPATAHLRNKVRKPVEEMSGFNRYSGIR